MPPPSGPLGSLVPDTGTAGAAPAFGSRTCDAVPRAFSARRLLGFLGPGYLIAVGYMDPGNWATDLAGGSGFGYSLLWIVLLSGLMAMFLQVLAARLGIVTGLDLAQACRAHARPRSVIPQWLLCEIAICATDLAEVIGTAIALKLLFGLPLMLGVLVTVFDVLLVLWLQQRGFRQLEAFVIALTGDRRRLYRPHRRDGAAAVARRLRRLRTEHADRHRPEHALHRDRDHRRDRDAAQPVPALIDREDAPQRPGGPALGPQLHDDRHRLRAGPRVPDQCVDTHDGRRRVPRPRSARSRRPAGCASPALGLGGRRHRRHRLRAGVARVGPELRGDRDADRPDRDGRLSPADDRAVAASPADPRHQRSCRRSSSRGSTARRRSPAC
jgi:hypothetical protein